MELRSLERNQLEQCSGSFFPFGNGQGQYNMVWLLADCPISETDDRLAYCANSDAAYRAKGGEQKPGS